MSSQDATNLLHAAYARNHIPFDDSLAYLPIEKKLELAEYWNDRADTAALEEAAAEDGGDDDSSSHDPFESLPITSLTGAKAIRKRLQRLAGLNHPISSGEKARREQHKQYHGANYRDR